jgi:hypothetical protein
MRPPAGVIAQTQVATRLPQDRIAYIEGKGTYMAALEARAVTSARSHTLSDDGR